MTKPATPPEKTTAARKRTRAPGRSRPTSVVAPYHHGAVPDAMLAAAQRLLETEGSAGLTLRAAARAAGVSHAAPKHHFGDLTGLLSELAALGFREFAAALDAAASGQADALPATRRAAVGAAYVRFAQARPALFLLMFRGERLDMQRPALRAAVDRARDALAGVAARQLGIDAAPQAPIGAEQGTRMVAAWSLVHGFAMLLIDGRLDPVLANWPAGTDWQSAAGAGARRYQLRPRLSVTASSWGLFTRPFVV